MDFNFSDTEEPPSDRDPDPRDDVDPDERALRSFHNIINDED